MTEEEFRAQAIADGFADFQFKHYAAGPGGPLHTHGFAVTLLVTAGEFALQFEDRKDTYRAGEGCKLAANVMHAECAGSEGAQVLLARKL